MDKFAHKKKSKSAVLLCMVLALFAAMLLSSCGQKEEQITKIEELSDKTIAAVSGSTFTTEIKADERLQNASVLYITSTADGFVKLLAKKTDALITDNVVAQEFAAKNNGVVILDEILNNSYYGFPMQKGDPRIDEFNSALAEMKADGTLQEMIDIWLGDDESLKSVPVSNNNPEKGTMLCYIDDTYEPISYHNANGDLVGLDVAVLVECGNRLGYAIEFETKAFSDGIPSVAAGLADISAGGTSITEERKQLVDFTDSYLDAGTVIVVRNVSVDTSAKGIWMSITESLNRVFVEEDRWKDLLEGLLMTILMTIGTGLVGFVFGFLLFFWDYSLPQNSFLHKVLAFICTAFALAPVSTILYIAYYIFFAGQKQSSLVAACTVLIVLFAADVYQYFMGHKAAVKKGEIEAAESMGYSHFQILKYIILPQALPGVVGNLKGEVKAHVKTTALVGLIAVVDLQTVADVVRAETLEPVLPLIITAVVYIGLGLIFSKLIEKIQIKVNNDEKTQEEIMARIEKGVL